MNFSGRTKFREWQILRNSENDILQVKSLKEIESLWKKIVNEEMDYLIKKQQVFIDKPNKEIISLKQEF